jgi:hypothetical protein
MTFRISPNKAQQAIQIADHIWYAYTHSPVCIDFQKEQGRMELTVQYSDIDNGVYHFYCTASYISYTIIKLLRRRLQHYDYDFYITMFDCLYTSLCAKRYGHAGQYSPYGAHNNMIVLSERFVENKYRTLKLLYNTYTREGLTMGTADNWHLEHRTRCVFVPYDVYRRKLKLHLFNIIDVYRPVLVKMGLIAYLRGRYIPTENESRHAFIRFIRNDAQNVVM